MDEVPLWIGVLAGGAGTALLTFALEGWRRFAARRARKVDRLEDELEALRNLPNTVADLARDLEDIDDRVADARELVAELTGLVRGLIDDGELRRRRR